MREPIGTLRSGAVAFAYDDVDTDQIVPARFLKVTDWSGLADALFADRRDVFDAAAARSTRILIAGRNFGCGSSREHAVWALQAFGFRAVVAPSFADIFRANALENGLLPIALDDALIQRATMLAERSRQATFVVDLDAQAFKLPDGTTAQFAIDAFAKRRLLAGTDTLDLLIAALPDIERHEREHTPLDDAISARKESS